MRRRLLPLSGVLALALLAAALFANVPDVLAQQAGADKLPRNVELTLRSNHARIVFDVAEDGSYRANMNVQYKLSSAEWSGDPTLFSRVRGGPELSFRDISGLQPNTAYDFRLRACNFPTSLNPNLCGNWVEVSGTTPQNQVPDEVRQLSGQGSEQVAGLSGDRSVRVTWQLPSNTHGTLTRQDIQWRNFESEETDRPAWSSNINASAGATQRDIDVMSSNRSQVRVRAVNANGPGYWRYLDISGRFGGPANLTATQASSTAIDVTWDAVSGATRYRVERKTGSGNFGSGQTVNTNSFEATGLQPDTEYAFRVRAESNQRNGFYAGNDGTKKASTAAAPEAPSNLRSTARTYNSITWEWNPPETATYRDYYVSYRRASDSNFIQSGIHRTQTSYTAPQLSTNTAYFIRVRACQSASNTNENCGPYVSLTTSTTPPVAPTAPRELTGLAAGNHEDRLSWNTPDDNGGAAITDYQVRSRAVGSTWGAWSTDAASTTRLRIVTKPGNGHFTGYEYQVRAVNSAGPGPESNTVSLAGRPGSPTALAAAAFSGTAIDVTWTAPTNTGGGPLTGYSVQWREHVVGNWSDHGADGTKNVGKDATSVQITGLDPDTNYNFRISATTNGNRRSYWTPGNEAVAAMTHATSAMASTDVALHAGNLATALVTVDVAGTAFSDPLLSTHFEVTGITGITRPEGDVLLIHPTVNRENANRAKVGIVVPPNSSIGANPSFKIRVKGEGHTGTGHLDTNALTVLPSPPTVPGSLSTGATTTSVTLTWQESSYGDNTATLEYQVRHKLASAPNYGVPTTVTILSHEETGLDHSTAYDFEVRACVDGVTPEHCSDWASASRSTVDVPMVATNGVATEDLDEADPTVGKVTITLDRDLVPGESVTVQWEAAPASTIVDIGQILNDDDFNEDEIISGSHSETITGGRTVTLRLTGKQDNHLEVAQREGVDVTITSLTFRPAGVGTDDSYDVDIKDSLPEVDHDNDIATPNVRDKRRLGFADDDTGPSAFAVAVTPNEVAENAGETEITVTITWDNGVALFGLGQDFDLFIGRDGDTATEGGANKDYDEVPDRTLGNGNRLGFASFGSSVTYTFNLTPNDDSLGEGNEFITILANNANFTNGFAKLTILDDDISARISSPASVNEFDLDGATLTVQLAAVTYVAGAPDKAHFTLSGVPGLSVTSATGGNGTDEVVLTLAHNRSVAGADISSDATLTVTVDMDATSHSGDLDATVQVNANEAPVITSPPVVAVNENSPLGTPVGSFTATDAEGDMFTWSLEGDDASFFEITSAGVLETAKHIDRETQASRSVTVKATDAHGDFSTDDVTVQVNDDDTDTGPNTSLTPTSGADPDVDRASRATYTITITGLWDDTVTPNGVPGGDHFTTFAGAVHNDEVMLVGDVVQGAKASAGVELLAETGQTGTLSSEVQTHIDAGNALRFVSLGAPFDVQPSQANNVRTHTGVVLTSAHPRITLLSMLAPTPDWFIGVAGLRLLKTDGTWETTKTIDLYPWDAGTEDDDVGFSTGGANTNPAENIESLRGLGEFTGKPIARIEFTRTAVEQAPVAPPGAAAASADGGADLSWTKPAANSGITKYQYRQKTTGAFGSWTDIPNSAAAGTTAQTENNAGYTVTGLNNGTEYTFELRAVNAVGAGAAASGNDLTTTPVGRPEAPTNFTVTAVDQEASPQTVDITWTTPNDGGSPITAYQIGIQEAETPGQPIIGLPFTDDLTSPASGRDATTRFDRTKDWDVFLRAHNAGGPGAWSDPFRVDRGPGQVATLTATGGERISGVDDADKVRFEWTPPTTGGAVDMYEYRIDMGTWTSLTSGTRMVDVTGLSAASAAFELRGVTALGVLGDPLTIEVFRQPAAPGNLSATASMASTDVTLTWDAVAIESKYLPSPYRMQYRVKTTDNSGTWMEGGTAARDNNPTGGKVTGLGPSIEYEFRVRAETAHRDGDWSATSNSVTTPAVGASASPDPIHEADLNGQVLTITLVGATFNAGVASRHLSFDPQVAGLSFGTPTRHATDHEIVTVPLVFAAGNDLTKDVMTSVVIAGFSTTTSDLTTPQITLRATRTDYDTDDDGLIEVADLAQLNALRWDLDGDGDPATANATDYDDAFPLAEDGMGCPADGCTGYELTANLNFDQNNDGEITQAGDPAYWNGGRGWQPIGSDTPAVDASRYNATFDGNENTISNLFISRGSTDDVGLFGAIGTAGVVRSLGVVDVSVEGNAFVGALSGSSYGAVSDSYAAGGTVVGNASTGSSGVGGLVGWHGGTIERSHATTAVSGGSRVGGLVGLNGGSISHSYAAGAVSGHRDGGGLVGDNNEGTIVASYATGHVTGEDIYAGGLVGSSSQGTIIASYASGAVDGSSLVGGLAGFVQEGTIIASYATGPVTGENGRFIGGFIGNLPPAKPPTLRHNYFDADTSGRTFGVGGDDNLGSVDAPLGVEDHATDQNNRLDPGETLTPGVEAKTTAELQSPTGYSGIYADWRNIDLNNDGTNDPEDTNDFWHFGTSSQYPALKADLDGDNTATWPEFGVQLRQPLRLTATLSANAMRVTLGWNEPAVPTELGGSLTPSYVLYRDGVALTPGPALGAITFQDSIDLTTGPGADYQLALLLDGQEAARSNLVRAGGYDRDGDGLIEITTLAHLDAVRYDLNGDGRPDAASFTDRQADIDAFEAAFGLPDDGQVCRDGRICRGYELMADLNFDENNDGDITSADGTYWNSGSGWEPIGDNDTPYIAAFDGNRRTISNLFISRGTDFNGVFGVIGGRGIVRNVGVVNADISGISSTKGALAGRNDGAISNSYATGIIITDAPASAGGLVGRLTGSITDSYASATVEAGDSAGGLVGQASELSTITRSYATGRVSGRQNIGGLVGHVGHQLGSATTNDGVVESSYATATVTGFNDSAGGLIGFAEDARIVASYATGPVTAPENAGGLVGVLDESSAVTDSYYDTDTSGQSGGTGPKSTANLQSPTSAADIYATWSADDWDFGTNSRYPVLKADFNGDNTASWQEFGYQVRDGLALTVMDSIPTAGLSWTRSTAPAQWGSPAFEYRVYRNGEAVVDSQPGITYSDSGLLEGPEYAYQVAVLVNGVEQRLGNIVRIGGYDLDGDGLIAITNLEQLNAIRWDPDGDGVPSTGNETAYAAAFPSGEGTVCPDGRTCSGYELMRDLDFNATSSYSSGAVNADWTTGTGWEPIGGSPTFSGTFQGNGKTISNLFIDTTDFGAGLFGSISGAISNLGLLKVNVKGAAATTAGALAASINDAGTVSGVYTTGKVFTSGNNAGGLSGTSDGAISSSYSTAAVTASGNNVGGLVGNIGFNPASITNSYATGPVSGAASVGGLVGDVQSRGPGTITNSYATGPVTGTGSNVGGLVGKNAGTITASYYDTETTGLTGGIGPQSTSALTMPTSNTGIFADWSTSAWNFSRRGGVHYPALIVDFDGNGTAGYLEFGYQIRTGPVLTLTADGSGAQLSWTRPSIGFWSPGPTLTQYQVYKDGAALGSPIRENFGPASLSYTDATFDPAADLDKKYHVAFLIEGANARTGNIESVGAPTITAVATEDLSEADTNAGGVTFTLSRALLSGESVIVTYSVVGSMNPISAADINESISVTGTDNTLTATSGSSVRIPITAFNDNIVEVAETELTVAITAIAFRPKDGNTDGSQDVDLLATAPAGTGDDKTLALMDNDVAPTSIVLVLDPDSVMEDAGQTNIDVTAKFPDGSSVLPGSTNVSVTVATGGARYSINNGSFTLTIPAGSLSSAAGTFMITPVDDSDSQPALNIAVSGTATVSGNSVATTSQLRLIDDDLPLVTFQLTPTSIAENGGTATLRATLSTAVTSPIAIIVSHGGGPAVNLSGTTLNIPNGQTASSNSITLTAVNNNVDAANRQVSITGTAPATVTAPAAVTLTINDDDTRGATVSQTSRTVGENGGQATYTIRLTSQPTSTVTITPVSSNNSIASVSGALTFTTGNWQNPQTVTITGVNDNVDNDGNQRTATITHTVSGGDYGSVTAAAVSVQVNDDDATPDRIILTANPASVAEDAGSAASVRITASFPAGSAARTASTVVTVGQTGGTATSGADYAAITPSSVTITIPSRSTSATATTTFSVDPINDSDSEGRETIVLGATTTPAGFTVTPAVFTIIDDDISAMIESTNPSPLTERTLDGARITVDLTATEYVPSLTPDDFGLLPQNVGGLSVESVSRQSDTRAVLTLRFTGDITLNVQLQVVVDASAHTEGGTLATGEVTVTPAPPPGQVTGVNADPGPGSLDVSWNSDPNADGYVVQYKHSSAPAYAAGDFIEVRGGSTTEASIDGLLGVTDYDVRVYATSNYAPDGPITSGSAASATTLPAHTTVSTDPSPLTERNLDGATLTVDLLDTLRDPWAPRLDRATVTVSGVPGVTLADVTRVSDRRMLVTLAYDDSEFDTDALLRVEFYLAHTSIETVTAVADVQAVVEAPPAQVQNVRATGGTRQVEVRWDGVPTAYENLDKNVYRVQWKGPGQSWRERKVRGSQTAMTIQGLSPGTEYRVRVIATRHKADDGQPSAEAQARTVQYRAWLSATEPAELTEANLRGAALLVDLQGSSWILQAAGRDNRSFYTVSGVPGVYVERVERVSNARLKVILGYRGEDFDDDRTLKLRIDGMHAWRVEINVTAPVKAVEEGLMNLQATGGERTVTVEWDEIDGASAYQLEWIETGVQEFGDLLSDRRRVVLPGAPYTISRNLKAGTHYTVRVAAFVRYKGFGDWVYATATTNRDAAEDPSDPLETAQNQRAGVTVKPTSVTLPEGFTGSYSLSLDGQPTGNVVITVSSDNADVAPYPGQLTFTPDNWQTEQLVGVPAAHDDDAADDTATISHEVSGADGYAGIDVATVSVSVTDADTAGVTVSESNLDITEGESATYTVVLDTQPIGDVLITVLASPGISAQPDEFTFTPGNWHTAQTVTVSAAQDDDTEDRTALIFHGIGAGPESGYAGVAVPGVDVSITDDDYTPQPAQQQPEPEPETDTDDSDQETEEPAVTDPNRAALEALYNATGGASWTNSANWLSEQPLAEWHGVTVNEQGEVTAVVLDGNNLTGSLPVDLGNLSGLSRLALNRNGITGAIPSQLGNLPSLSIIGIARNSLSGNLPTELGNLSGLTRLSLHDNTALSGALPSGFASLMNLQRLAIANTGICIPAGDAFSDWLAAVPDKPGIEGLTTCASP